MRAMILSAGYGTRLWPLTEDRTKPALPILGKPLVGYVAEYLARFGCNDIIVNLHYRPDSVKRALGDGSRFGVKLTYVEEPVILGTSGALDNARTLLDSDTFIVINGKIITDIDLAAALKTHRETGALATMVLLPNVRRERFSMVELSDGRIVRFAGMPAANESAAEQPPWMFTGIHILEPRIFDYIPRGVFSDSVTDVYPQAIANGERVSAHAGQGTWYELSTIQRYLEISLRLLAQQGRSVFAGAACEIASTATVHESILWDRVTIGKDARVSRAIIGDGVHIPDGAVIENAAVVRNSLIADSTPPAKALKGEQKGDNFVVPLGQ